MNVLADLDELIARDDDAADYCSETGPNDAMRRATELRDIRAAVAELISAAEADCRLSEESGINCARLRAALAKVKP